jgi:serine protease Do
MTHARTVWRWTSRVTAFVAVVAVVAIVANRSHGAPTPSRPLWTTRPSVTTAEHPWVSLARELKPAVVNVSTKRTEPDAGPPTPPFRRNDPFDWYLGPFLGDPPPHTVRSLGSGFVINADGYVVTNNHVVDGASDIRVKLADGREFRARMVGRDARTDVALLKIAASGLPVVPLADTSAIEVGEPVMAIGNPFGLEQTVTTGIVSATGRIIGAGASDDFIQTDASINPGNSGGPLIDLRGQAIGINTAIFTADGGSNGIGFAIPISLARTVLAQLAARARVVSGWLGVEVQPMTTELAQSLHAPGPGRR